MWGGVAYLVAKWAIPFLKLISARADVEGAVFDSAKDSIKFANEQLGTLRKDYAKLVLELEETNRLLRETKSLLRQEQQKRCELEAKLNKFLGDGNGQIRAQ